MITILVGKSACGKDTALNELCENGWERIVSATTRPMREGEVSGREYNFVSNEAFQKAAEAGAFMEQRSYNTLVGGKPEIWHYAAPKVDNTSDKDYVVIVDTAGCQDFIDFYGRDNCFVVSMELDDATREQRAMGRGSFDKTEWDRRLVDDTVKFSNEIVDGIANFRLNTEGLDVDETIYCVDEALCAYKTFQLAAREEGKQYIVVQERTLGGYYEEPEDVFRVYEKQKFDKMVREEENYLSFFVQDCRNNDYAIIGNTEAPENGKIKVFYTVKISDAYCVDVMCVSDQKHGTYEYCMQNEDGSTVFDNKGDTFPNVLYDEERCKSLAKERFQSEYSINKTKSTMERN